MQVVSSPRPLRIQYMGTIAYGPMLALQEETHREVAQGLQHDTLFLLEHHPVVTLGRNSQREHVLVSPEHLKQLGYDYAEIGRGGDVTYHGPGQLVGYPIIALQPHEQDVRLYVHRLEEALIRTAAEYGIVAERIEGLRGIWVGDAKLAAIGVRIARWVTLHGFAFNVNTPLQQFDVIVPCGLHQKKVTSLQELLKRPISITEVREHLRKHVAQVLNREAYDE